MSKSLKFHSSISSTQKLSLIHFKENFNANSHLCLGYYCQMVGTCYMEKKHGTLVQIHYAITSFFFLKHNIIDLNDKWWNPNIVPKANLYKVFLASILISILSKTRHICIYISCKFLEENVKTTLCIYYIPSYNNIYHSIVHRGIQKMKFITFMFTFGCTIIIIALLME